MRIAATDGVDYAFRRAHGVANPLFGGLSTGRFASTGTFAFNRLTGPRGA